MRVAINNKAKFIPIKIIRDAEEDIWVTGLPNSAEVIVVGQEYVTDNSNIKVSPNEIKLTSNKDIIKTKFLREVKWSKPYLTIHLNKLFNIR